MNSQDFPAYMRVTLGLGATTTAVPPSAAVGGATYPQAIQVNPRPLPGPGRWVGTAEGARRSRSHSGVAPPGSDRHWSDRDDVDPGSGRADSARTVVRSGSARPEADRYRGSRQWSDRDGTDRDRNDEWIARPGALYGTPPITRGSFPPPLRLRAPGARVTPALSARPVIPARAPSAVPAGAPIGDDSDPTPLFTATEYVAVGDSPLYQYVAELIAVGDALPGTGVTEPPAPVNPPVDSMVPAAPVPSAAAPHFQASDLQGSVQPSSDLDGGKHRDEWRVAGQRSAIDGSRRSNRRSPRHRAA